jgi:exodeoxyribonuclease VII small subunit
MAQAKKSGKDYAALSDELAQILDDLQREDNGIEDALKQYERGLVIIAELEAYLEHAENTVHELKAKFGSSEQ